MVNINPNFLTRAQFNNPTARTQGTGSNIAGLNSNNRRTQVGQLPTMKLGGTEGTRPESGIQIKKDYGTPDKPISHEEWSNGSYKEGDVVYFRNGDEIYKAEITKDSPAPGCIECNLELIGKTK